MTFNRPKEISHQSLLIMNRNFQIMRRLKNIEPLAFTLDLSEKGIKASSLMIIIILRRYFLRRDDSRFASLMLHL